MTPIPIVGSMLVTVASGTIVCAKAKPSVGASVLAVTSTLNSWVMVVPMVGAVVCAVTLGTVCCSHAILYTIEIVGSRTVAATSGTVVGVMPKLTPAASVVAATLGGVG